MSLNDPKTGMTTYNIDKLTESNYRSWSQQIKWILDEWELLEIVEGKAKKPGDGEDLAVWSKNAKKARSIIGATMSDSVMRYIEGMMDTAVMWTTLEVRYNSKIKTRLFQTILEFMNVKMGERDDEQ